MNKQISFTWVKAASKAKCSQYDEKYGWKKKSRDEEGDVPLGSFDLAFCSIDFVDPAGVKIKNQGHVHIHRALAEEGGWF